jgi:hypothetical protein
MNRAQGRVGWAADTYPQTGRVGGSSGALAAANIAAASALNFVPVDGTWIYVDSVKDYFYYDGDSNLVVDGITIIPSFMGGNTRLIRADYKGHPSWALQASWGINGTTGNDENPGSLAQPLKTWGEFERRVKGNTLDQNTTVRFLDDQAPNDLIQGTFRVRPGFGLGIQGGVKQVVRTAAITNLAAINRAANQPLIVSDATIATWAPYVGMRIAVAGGPNNGETGWVLVVNGGDATTCNVSRPTNVPTNPLTPWLGALALGTFTNGDTYEVQQLVQATLGSIIVEVDGTDLAGTPSLGFADLTVVGANDFLFLPTCQGPVVFYGCYFLDSPLQQTAQTSVVYMLNCGMSGGVFVSEGQFYAQAGYAFPFVAAPSPAILVNNAYVNLDGDFTAQGGGISIGSGKAEIGFAAAFDATAAPGDAGGAGLNVGGGATPLGGFCTPATSCSMRTGLFGGNSIWGAGNVVGVQIGAGCFFGYDADTLLAIAGAGANDDWRLGTAANTVQAIDAGGAAIGPNAESWGNLAAARPGGFGGFASNPTNLATICPNA